jgi:ParB family transcriptional regulator, chromosome partitioning protein
MVKQRRQLTLKNGSETESKLEDFVLNGKFTNFNGQPAWSESPLVSVELDRIILPQFQLRLYYDRVKIEQIKATIQSVGIREPILLRPHPVKDGYFELIAGSQRRLSAEELGISTVPAKVDDVDDLTAIKIALIENDARSDFNPYERTRGIAKILEVALQKSTDEVIQALTALFNAQNRQNDNNDIIISTEHQFIVSVFDEMGLHWKSFVTNQLPLLKLPIDVISVLEKGEIEYTKAIKIARIKDESLRQEILLKSIERKLSIKQIQDLIDRCNLDNPKNMDSALRDRARSALVKVTSPKLLKDPKIRKRVENITKQLENLIADLETVLD